MMRARPVKSPPADLFEIVPNSVVGGLVASPGAVLATLQSSARQDRPKTPFRGSTRTASRTRSASRRIWTARTRMKTMMRERDLSPTASPPVDRGEEGDEFGEWPCLPTCNTCTTSPRWPVVLYTHTLSASSLSFYLSLLLPLPLLSHCPAVMVAGA